MTAHTCPRILHPSTPAATRMSPAEIAPSAPFLKLVRSATAESLLRYPNCFAVLTLIALRARREVPAFNPEGMTEGEAMVGDFVAVGLTRQEFRTAISNLQKWGFITTRATNKGTIAKLCNTDIYDINRDEIAARKLNQQSTTKQPTGQPAINHQTTSANNCESTGFDGISKEANQQSTTGSAETQPAVNQQSTTKKKERKKEERRRSSSLRSEDAANAAAGEPEKKIEPETPQPENPDASASHTRGAADVGTRKAYAYDPAAISTALVLPFNTDTFRAAWIGYRQYREEQKFRRYTGGMMEQEALRTLGNLAGGNEDTAHELIAQAIRKGWQDIYKLDEPRAHPQQHAIQPGPNGRLSPPSQVSSRHNAIEEARILRQNRQPV